MQRPQPVHFFVFIGGGDAATSVQGEFQLLPGAALDFGAGIVAGTDGDNDSCRLFAGAAAGEAEGVRFGACFHT
jgi:hypothetical protein